MPRKSDARERLMRTAIDLFQRQGYNGTGLTQILEESGAPKGSFYHHFPEGKEALAEAAVLQAGEEIGELIDRSFEDRSFVAGTETLARSIADWFSRSDYAAGCPITAVMLDCVPAYPRLASASTRVFADWSDRIASHALRNGHDEERAGLLGETVLVTLEGAWVRARASRSTAPFGIAAKVASRAVQDGPNGDRTDG